MNKKYRLYLFATLLFLAAAAFFQNLFTREYNLERRAQRLEEQIREREGDLLRLLEVKGFVEGGAPFHPGVEAGEDGLEASPTTPYAEVEGNLCLYRGDSLLFWLNTRQLVPEQEARELQRMGGGTRLLERANGFWYVRAVPREDSLWAFVLLPLKSKLAPNLEGFRENALLLRGWLLPRNIVLSFSPTPFPVHDSNGAVLFWLDAPDHFKEPFQLRLLLALYLLAFFSLCLFINRVALDLVDRYSPLLVATFLVASIVLLVGLAYHFDWTQTFSELESFRKIFNTPVLNLAHSLGDLLIHVVLILWLMVFFHRKFELKEMSGVPVWLQFVLTLLFQLAAIMGVLMTTLIFRSLVLDSEYTFNLRSLLQFNTYSTLSLAGVILLLVAMFLFTHRIMLSVTKVGLEGRWRWLSLGLALLLTFPLLDSLELELNPALGVLGIGLFLVVFHFFIEAPQTNITWLLIWMFTFSILTALLLNFYNDFKDRALRQSYARALADYRDSLSIAELELLGQRLSNSRGELAGADTLDCSLLRRHTWNLINEQVYLSRQYRPRLQFIRPATGEPLCPSPYDSRADWRILFPEGEPLVEQPTFQIMGLPRKFTYLLRAELPLDPPLHAYLSFQRAVDAPGSVFQELVVHPPYKNLRYLKSYAFALYRDGELLESAGMVFEHRFNDTLPPAGTSVLVERSERHSELIYHAPNGVVVRVVGEAGGFWRAIPLASILFVLLLLAVGLLAFFNFFLQFLPPSLHFSISRPLTLRTRFQLLILGIILISFLMHAGATFLYFRQSSRKYPYEQLEQRLRMVRKAAAMRLQESGWHLPDPGGFVEDLSEVYETDVNLYDPQGRLLAASEQSVYNNDILAPRMDLWAWRQFRDFGAHTFIHHERAGRFPYLMGYLPLESSDGQVLGFLGVPHYASQSDLRAGLSEFMTTIITVYVLLLIIAGSIAILTFRTLTKPLSDLADSISRVKLGHNEPLPWPNTNDEISELVNQFNKMQQRLEEQKERLFQAERESAWREMARQVTHEIKTPLTPMKLKVELLLSMLNNGSPPDEHQIRRTFHSLIEQINSLSHIASAFNDFAQINDPKPELFLLNDLASSVFELFAGGHEEVQFHLYLPDRQFFVFSDRELLRRVLNNLLKNALEAIPSGRMGVIELRLQQEEADRVLLSVRDNGCGIPAEKQNTIFTPNFTTKSTGMGLGLAMCKKIIEKLHGDIFFESVEGQGTIFYVSLPLEEVQQLQEI